MAQYQKFMFDNFVISCNDDKCVARPLDESDAETEEIFFEEIEARAYPQALEAKVIVSEPEVAKAPVHSQEEFDTAVSAAEEKGYENGFNAALSDSQKLQQSVLEEVNTRVMTLLADEGETRRKDEQSALKFAIGLVRKLLPSLEESVAKQEVQAFLSDNFASFSKESSLSFSFHPEMAAEVAPLLSKLAEKNDFEGKIAVHKDINLGLSDCRVEWKNGGVERNTAGVLDKVEELLK